MMIAHPTDDDRLTAEDRRELLYDAMTGCCDPSAADKADIDALVTMLARCVQFGGVQ